MSRPSRPGFSAAATREAVLERAVETILGNETVDVRTLARQSGVGRSTLYRWFGGRSGLVGEALWLLTDQAWHGARARAPESGPEHALVVFELFMRRVRVSSAAESLLATERREALLVIMSPTGVVQRRAVARTLQLLIEHTDLERDARPVAEVLTQVVMTTVWALVLVDQAPDIDAALAVCRRLIV